MSLRLLNFSKVRGVTDLAIFTDGDVYSKLGVRHVINAMGNQTVLGGSSPSDVVRESMENANLNYVEMRELLEKSGEFIAGLLGTEAAYVTAGGAAAMALSTAACMAGNDPDKILQLPDTTGMKNQIILQQKQRYSYDRVYGFAGADLITVGDDQGCTSEELSEAITPKTVAIAYFVQPDWDDSVVSLEETVRIAHEKGIKVIADAASQIYPLDYMRSNATGADLVCFGAKYLGAPHDTGFVCGTKDLIDAVSANGFIGLHTGGRRAIGRAYKVTRQGIVAVVAALDEWFTINHEDRLLSIDDTLTTMKSNLQGILNAETNVVHQNQFMGSTLHVKLSPDSGLTAEGVLKQLDEGTPRIWANSDGEDTLTFNAHTLKPGEEDVVVERLKEIIS